MAASAVGWAEFADAVPDIAERGADRFAHGIAWIATTTADGRPSVHPITPLLAHGRLLAFIALGTPKERNLRAGGRYALHGVLGEDDEEFAVSGRVVVADDPESRALAQRAADAIGMTSKNDVVMEFLIERAHWAVWEGLGTPDVRRRSKSWRADA
jgi:hypothetical protein